VKRIDIQAEGAMNYAITTARITLLKSFLDK